MAIVNSPQYTLQYKTFVKRAMQEALTAAFTNHSDPQVQRIRVALSYNEDDFALPAITIGFQEGNLLNAGVGHFEWGADPNDPYVLVKFQHRTYKGNIVFSIWAMSTIDEATVSDALVEVLAMDEASIPGQGFVTQLFNERLNIPYGGSSFATLNFDTFDPTGETYEQAPWAEEDQKVYGNGYRIAIFGEFYSYVPPEPMTFGPVEEVDVYGYPTANDEETAIDPLNQVPPAEPETDWMYITGNPPGDTDI